MTLAPLSAAMVLSAPRASSSPAPTGSGFSAVLDAVSAAEPAAESTGHDDVTPSSTTAPSPGISATTSGSTPTLASTAMVPSTFGQSSGSSAASAGLTAPGIFGYGRAGMFNPGERARMAQLVAQAAPILNAQITTPIASPSSVAPASDLPANHYKDLLAGLAKEFDVPESFITAVMFAESGGNPNAVGDNGHSVGLFQLHDQGMGYGMGDDRYDPAKNARVGVAGLATGWHAGKERGLSGEELVRFAYDNRFNPGGGWKIQGDRVVSYWKKLEAVSNVDSSGSAFGAKSLMWPVSGGHVTQEAHEGHMATDIGVVVGTPVVSVASGTVVSVERLDTGYGWNVVVDHGGGWQTRYAHASEIDVEVGQQVAAGQQIMLSGNTGKSTGPHLHFEVIYNGERQDPLVYLR